MKIYSFFVSTTFLLTALFLGNLMCGYDGTVSYGSVISALPFGRDHFLVAQRNEKDSTSLLWLVSAQNTMLMEEKRLYFKKYSAHPLQGARLKKMVGCPSCSQILLTTQEHPSYVYLLELLGGGGNGITQILQSDEIIGNSSKKGVKNIPLIVATKGGYIFCVLEEDLPEADTQDPEKLANASLIAVLQRGHKKEENGATHLALVSSQNNVITRGTLAQAIGNVDLVVLQSLQIESMEWDDSLNVLYLVCSYQAVVGADQRTSVLMACAPATGNNDIHCECRAVRRYTDRENVECRGAHTMLAPAGFNYLLIADRPKATEEIAETQIGILPLCNAASSRGKHALHGMLAYEGDGVIKNSQLIRDAQIVTGAHFEAALLSAGQRVTTVLAGNQPLRGNIKGLNVVNTTLFVTLNPESAPDLTQVIATNALFHKTGTLSGFTEWRKIATETDHLLSFSFNAYDDSCSLLMGDKESGALYVKNTEWRSSSDTYPFIALLNNEFVGTSRGIDKCVSFDTHTLATPGSASLAFLTERKLALVPRSPEATYTYRKSLKPYHYTHGAIGDVPEDEGMLLLSGGALDAIAPLRCAEFVSVNRSENLKEGFFCVGGAHGLALLVDDQGKGWQVEQGQSVGTCVKKRHFIIVGSYSFVRKLIASENRLYVLTDHQFDCIDLAKSDLAMGHLEKVTLATSQQFGVYPFVDATIFGDLKVLATGQQLWSTTENSAKDWNEVSLPQHTQSLIEEIHAVATIPRTQECHNFTNGGMLLVLSNAYNGDICYVDCFALDGLAALRPLSCPNINGKPIYYRRLRGRKATMAIKGETLYFAQRNGKAGDDLYVIGPRTEAIKVTIPSCCREMGAIKQLITDPVDDALYAVGNRGIFSRHC